MHVCVRGVYKGQAAVCKGECVWRKCVSVMVCICVREKCVRGCVCVRGSVCRGNVCLCKGRMGM